MKNKNHRLSLLKHQMFQQKNAGRQEVVRKLTIEEVEYLEAFFEVNPYLYEIKLTFKPDFVPTKSSSWIVKDLFYGLRKNHKRSAIRHLTPKQATQCVKAGLPVKPYKYKVKFS